MEQSPHRHRRFPALPGQAPNQPFRNSTRLRMVRQYIRRRPAQIPPVSDQGLSEACGEPRPPHRYRSGKYQDSKVGSSSFARFIKSLMPSGTEAKTCTIRRAASPSPYGFSIPSIDLRKSQLFAIATFSSMASLLASQSRVLRARSRPCCRMPMLTTGTANEAASMIPLLEFPISRSAQRSKLQYEIEFKFIRIRAFLCVRKKRLVRSISARLPASEFG